MAPDTGGDSFKSVSTSPDRRSVLQAIGVTLTLPTVSRNTGGESTQSVDAKRSASGSGLHPTQNSVPHRPPPPGPPVLYDSLSSAPQLQNDPASRWSANPLLVCGTDAYVNGEYLYQDYIYDDYGADTAPRSVPSEPNTDDNSSGDFRYPTDPDRYAYNAADLLEFRARSTPNGIAYRVRLNTMLDPAVAGVAIGIDTGGRGRSSWGYGIGSLGDLELDHVVTTWGTAAELDGESIPSSVDIDRNQIEVDVPLNPGTATWRHYVVVGLFETDRRRFKQIQTRPSPTHPGGSNGRDPPPIFNVGFRFDEPLDADPIQPTGYREAAQATALAARDISSFHADIDFARLQPPTPTRYHIPESGFLNRLYASRLDRGDGIDADDGSFVGPIQPYSVYLPEDRSGGSTPLHLSLHSGTNTHNDFGAHMPNRIRQFCEARGTIGLTPLARSTSGFYMGDDEYAVFEAWNDLAHRYDIDFGRVTIGGHSMGSYGTYKLVGSYPDLFASAFTTTGATGDVFTDRSAVTGEETHDVTRLSENLRHVPILMWYGAADELVPLPTPLTYEQRLRNHEFRHELDVFTADHFIWPHLDEWDRAQAFLNTHESVTRVPARITFRRIPEFENEDLELGHDSAYWLSDIQIEDTGSSGVVDAASGAVETAEPIAVHYEATGTEPLPYVARGTRWETPRETVPIQNRLEMRLDDVSAVTVWVEEAQLEPTEPLQLSVTTTTPVTVTLAGQFGTRKESFQPGQTTRVVTPDG